MKNIIPLSIKLRKFVFSTIGKYSSIKSCPVVFCFHSVAVNDWIFNVNPNKFDSLIKELSKTRRVISLRRMLNESENEMGDKVSITFDDGYEDVFINAYPILRKYGIKACVFINGTPDKKGDFGYLDGRKLLNLDQIKKLKKVGWEIGYHTKTHSDLRNLSKEELELEIVRSKKKLEKDMGFKIDYFAYPHGVFNDRVLKTVRKAGYEYAFTVSGGGFSKKENYKIDRLLIDRFVNFKDIGVITSCQGLYFNKLLTRFIRIKDNILKN